MSTATTPTTADEFETRLRVNLKDAIEASGKMKKELATALGMDGSKFSHSLSGRRRFTVEEISTLCGLLGITRESLTADMDVPTASKTSAPAAPAVQFSETPTRETPTSVSEAPIAPAASKTLKTPARARKMASAPAPAERDQRVRLAAIGVDGEVTNALSKLAFAEHMIYKGAGSRGWHVRLEGYMTNDELTALRKFMAQFLPTDGSATASAGE